jgi:hypothetical protein
MGVVDKVSHEEVSFAKSPEGQNAAYLTDTKTLIDQTKRPAVGFV